PSTYPGRVRCASAAPTAICTLSLHDALPISLDLRRGTDIEGPHLDLDEFRQRHRDVLRVDARTAVDRRRIFPREDGRLHPFANWVTTTMKVPVRIIRAGARTTGDSSTRRAPHP